MTNWPAFAGFTGVVLAALLVLARLSQAALDDAARDGGDRRTPTVRPPADRRPDAPRGTGTSDADDPAGSDERPDDRSPDGVAPGPWPDDPLSDPPVTRGETDDGPDRTEGRAAPGAPPEGRPPPDAGDLSTPVLLANVAVSQGVLGTLLLAGAWYAAVPPAALGADRVGPGAAAVGVGLGAALYAANEAGAAVGRHVGLGGGEELRAALAPETTGEWAALLLVVLPVIAGFEELLFRGVLVGAMSAGFGLSPWLLAVGSSVAFAAGHGAQGRVGMAVTGTLGFVLAAAFVVTGSLLTVVVAHYLVNALEFLVHEWAGIDPAEGKWRPGD